MLEVSWNPASVAIVGVVGIRCAYSFCHLQRGKPGGWPMLPRAAATTCSISSKNNARRVFFVYRSNAVIAASVLCLLSEFMLP
jgi:hypothetical protein